MNLELLLIFFLIEVLLIYSVFLVYSKVIQLYIDIFFFHILFHYGLLQDIEYSSLYYTVGHCLFF